MKHIVPKIGKFYILAYPGYPHPIRCKYVRDVSLPQRLNGTMSKRIPAKTIYQFVRDIDGKRLNALPKHIVSAN